MSLALYKVRVYYSNGSGCVLSGALYKRITEAPCIPEFPALRSIDFAPETATYLFAEPTEREAEMTDVQIAAVHAWIAEFVLAGDGA